MRRALASLCVLQTFSTGLWAEPSNSSMELSAIEIGANADASSEPRDSYRATRSSSATRTDTDIHETPQSVSVVTAKVLEDSSVTRLQDALDYAGGVGRANNFGGQGLTTYTVRGFTTGEFYRNGFPVNRGYPNAPDTNTIDHIDVLRGPAATMYGRSDPGGTFNVVTKQPEVEQKTTVGGQLDDQGMYRSTLDTTGALNDSGSLTYRLNLLGEGGDSFRDDVETERYDLAPVVSWQINDTTNVTFEGDYMRNNHPLDRGNTHYPNQIGTGNRDTYVWEKGSDNLLHNDNNVSQLRFEHLLDNDWKLSGGVQRIDGKLFGNAVEGNSVQADGRTLNRNFNWRKLEWNDTDFQLNLSGSFATGSIQHTLLAGLEYEDYDYQSIIQRSSSAYPIDIFNPVLGQPRPALTRTTTHDKENLKSTAAFVQDQMALTERLKFLIGARVERDEHDYDNKLPGSTDWNQTESAVTPRYGLVYDLTPQLAVYGSFSESFKPNTGAARNGGGFDAEEGKSYELGVKWKTLDDQLAVDAAVFHTVKKNVLTLDPADPSGTFSVAAGKVRSRGFDVNVSGNITQEWRMLGNYSYVDAEVAKDNSLPTGTRLANIPRNSFNLLNVYEFKSGQLQGLGLGLGVRHVDDRAGQTAARTYNMDSYTVADLLSFYQITPKLRVNLDVKNLFDEDYEEGAFNLYAYPGAPRTVQTGFTYTF